MSQVSGKQRCAYVMAMLKLVVGETKRSDISSMEWQGVPTSLVYQNLFVSSMCNPHIPILPDDQMDWWPEFSLSTTKILRKLKAGSVYPVCALIGVRPVFNEIDNCLCIDYTLTNGNRVELLIQVDGENWAATMKEGYSDNVIADIPLTPID